jgi:hypothetical protein
MARKGSWTSLEPYIMFDRVKVTLENSTALSVVLNQKQKTEQGAWKQIEEKEGV